MDGLVIDDDVVYARVLQRSLRRRGLAVQLAHDGATALRLASERLQKFALVDLCIGHESGLNLIGPLRAIHAGMRIVLVSGYANAATIDEAVRRGADLCLLKPLTAEELLRELRG
jgi:two-component system response regulator RegA